MKMRLSRLIAVLLVLMMLFTAVSCENKDDGSEATPDAASTETSTAATPDEAAVPDAAASPQAQAALSPLLWRVTDKDGHSLYLFGTIHAGDERNETVLERLSPTLESCDALAVEFDVVAYSENMQQMISDMQPYLLTDGSVVSDYMPEELYQRSYELLEHANLSPGLYCQFNLAWWAQLVDTALLIDYCDLDTEEAMDSLLIHRANDKNLPVLEVESSAFQMTLLNSFDNDLYLLQIENALDTADAFDSDINEMYDLWLSGDKDTFWSYLTEEDAEDDAGAYTEEQIAMIEDYNQRMLDDRNLGMRDKALEYLNSGQTVFFAVGAAHMADKTGLVQLLTDAGCTVEPITY